MGCVLNLSPIRIKGAYVGFPGPQPLAGTVQIELREKSRRRHTRRRLCTQHLQKIKVRREENFRERITVFGFRSRC